MSVELKVSGNKVNCFSPYHPDFPKGAKKLGGKWDARQKCWVFDVRDTDRVKALLKDIYGTDGSVADSEKVDVRLVSVGDKSNLRQSVFFAGRLIARAMGRDSGARLGEGVIMLKGKIASGGSMKNWHTYIADGSVFEVRDVPATALELEDDDDWLFTIIKNDVQIDKAELEKEKEKLLARIAEIDQILEGEIA